VTRKGLLAFVLLLLFVPICGARPANTGNSSGLSFNSFFSPGTVLQDLNGDGITDWVNLRIIVPENASVAEIGAASELSARLGYETTAMELSLISTPGTDPSSVTQPVVLIGRSNKWVSFLAEQKKLQLPTLAPGQGAAIILHSAFGANDALVLFGADDAGTIAIAKAVASRFPYAGAIGGAKFGAVENDLAKTLGANSVQLVSAPSSTEFLADSGSETLRLSVGMDFSSEKDFREAEQLIQSIAGAAAKSEASAQLRYPGLQELEVQLSAGNLRRSIAINGSNPERVTPVVSSTKPVAKRIDLAGLYSTDGLFEDTNNDMIPDTSLATLVLGHGANRPGVAALAARLGLESAGISLPLTRQVSSPENVPKNLVPILIEDKGPLTNGLRQSTSLGAGQSGEGRIQVVREESGSQAILLSGADAAGMDAALDYAADRLPHLQARGKDQPTLGDIADEARVFFAGRSQAGQAAMAVYKLDQMLADLKGKSLDSLEAKIYVDDAPPAFQVFLEKRIASDLGTQNASVKAASLNIHSSIPIFEENEAFPWEVDDFWKIFREKILPGVRKGSQTTLELRVSESPEIRKQLAAQIRSELEKKSGRSDSNVVVLSAHKAGYTWLTEVVEPAIRGKDIGRIHIRFAELKPVNNWQLLYSKIRWLQELFPVDEILARDLGIPLTAVEFEEKSEDSPTYNVSVTDKSGQEIYHGQLDGKLISRPFFDQFPDYDTVQVSTGWVKATAGGKTLADERIVTDLEKFWDYYQKVTLPHVYSYVMDLYGGKPRAKYAPYFGELRIDLTASEANYRIGVDQEIFSPMDAVSEDIYYDTLAFFDTMGLRTVGEKLWHPGRILPYMRPSDVGGPAKLHVVFTGKPAGYPQVVIRYQEHGGQPTEVKEAIGIVDVELPKIDSVTVRSGEKGIERVGLDCKVDMINDERKELLRRHPEEDIERLILSQQQASRMINVLGELQRAGLYTDAFGYQAVRQLDFNFQFQESEESVALQSTGKKPNGDASLLATGYKYNGEQIVQWDNPINPDQGEQIISKLATFPEFTAYHAGQSYLGRDIWAMDIMLPMKASHWSQAKLSTVKPVLFITARQHGNETSGTSHVLRLAELIATNPDYTRYLNRLNIVMLPITNPDGAAFARELAAITPDFILHAGYFGALGTDMTAQQWARDPIYPEAKVRPKLWRTWLPDIMIDPHGSPQHEWLQIFAGYPAWVTSRTFLLQDWQIARGWWTSVRWVDGPKYPHHKEVSLALRDYVIDGVKTLPEVMATDKRMDSRFDRYGQFDPGAFKSEYYRGVRISEELRAFNPDAPSASPLADLNIPLDFAERFPNVTVRFGHRTESPDETARGDWLKLFASAGLQFDLASVKYLYDAKYEVKRTQDREGESVRLATTRPRPPLPGKKVETIP
jgi:hypothetical protein